MKHALRVIDILMFMAVMWGILSSIPLKYWGFEPLDISVADSTPDKAPKVVFDYVVTKPILLNKSTAIYSLNGNQLVCDDYSSVVRYVPEMRLPSTLTIQWFAPHDWRCSYLSGGSYYMEVCWTAPDLLDGVIPDKTVCKESNVFNIKGYLE